MFETIEVMNEDDELYSAIFSSAEFVKLTKTHDGAGKLYAALCNMQWKKHVDRTEAEEIIHTLSSEPDDGLCSYSWRAAAGVVAELRNLNIKDCAEDYVDWYCNGGEGDVDEAVRVIFENMNWYPVPWNDE